MADTLPKLLQEIHSIRTASELQSQLSSLRARIAALRTDETSIIYAANHTTRELNNKLFNFGLKSELDLTQLDGGLRPILSSSGGGGGGGISNPTYSITLNAGANTTLTSTKTSAQSGESVTITATANDGYTLASFIVDGNEETSPHTFTMPARNISSSTTAEALTLNAPSLTTSAGDYEFDNYNSSTQNIVHDEDDYQNTDNVYEDYNYSITIDLTASDASTVSNNGGTITSYEFSYSTDSGTSWTVLQDTNSTTFSHRFGQSLGVKWKTGQAYKVGQIVHHGGIEYKVLIAHTSASGPAHSSMSSHFEQTGFKIENFLGSSPYTPWYRVIAKNSSGGYESSPSTIVKYAFVDDTTTYFSKEEGTNLDAEGNLISYWTPISSTSITTAYSKFFYMKGYGSGTGVNSNGSHDTSLSDLYGDGTIVHTAGTSGGASKNKNVSLRWEDPNAPRTKTSTGGYAGGDNISTGNWGWFSVTDNYLTKMKFVKFDIDDS